MNKLTSKSLIPIASAVSMALIAGSAIASGWNNMSQTSKDAYREGQIWATYVVNPALQSYKIDADVNQHKVTLTGTVESKYEKLLAGNIAQSAKEITTVDNEIKVDPVAIVVTTFTPLNVYAQKVRNATTSAEVNSQLLWNEYTDGLDIDVVADHGKVTLTGVADTKKASQRAESIAANTRGVTSVDNQLTVNDSTSANSKDDVSDKWIADKIQTSYMYAFHVNSSDISTDVNHGKVTLSGNTGSDFERQRAINIAQNIRGVDSVNADALHVTKHNNHVAMD